MANVIIVLIVVILVCLACYHIYKEKKKGAACIGCPSKDSCPHAKKGCDSR